MIGHGMTCNILLLLHSKIDTQGLILLFGGGETEKQRIVTRCGMDSFGRMKEVREREVEKEYKKSRIIDKRRQCSCSRGRIIL